MCVNPGLSNPSCITQIQNGCGETGRISGGKNERGKTRGRYKKNKIKKTRRKLSAHFAIFYINSTKHAPTQRVGARNVFWKSERIIAFSVGLFLFRFFD